MSERSVLREKYEALTAECIELIEGLNIKDKRGHITDSGFVLIYRVMKKLKKDNDITEQIDIIGHEKWKRLNEIWNELELLDIQDKKYIKK